MVDYEIKNGVGIIPEGTTCVENVYQTKSGKLTVCVDDVLARGELYLDRDSYVTKYQYYSSDLYRVVSVDQNYLAVTDNQAGPTDSRIMKLYPNLETDYFTELPPSEFKKQWDYDKYYPSYYCALSVDGDIRQPELYSEEELDKLVEDDDSNIFTIEGETWEDKALIDALERQFEELFPSRTLEVIEFAYKEHAYDGAVEYFFNCVADDMNFQIMINSKTGTIHWDKEL